MQLAWCMLLCLASGRPHSPERWTCDNFIIAAHGVACGLACGGVQGLRVAACCISCCFLPVVCVSKCLVGCTLGAFGL